MRFKNYLTEVDLYPELEQLVEKLIRIKGSEGDNYGNIIILAGGAGSGKGFAISNFLEGEKYKIRDVDEVKKGFIKLADLKNKYPEIQNLTLTNPKHVNRLHVFITKKRIKDKTLDLLLRDVNEKRLPNIIFDITFRKSKKADFIKKLVDEIGYNSKDINLVWVLTNYQVAVKQNRNPERARIVPEDVLLQTHEGAALSMIEVVKGENPLFKNKKYFDGGVYVILGGKKHSIVWTDKEGKPIMTKVDPEMMKKLGFKASDRKPQPVIKDFKYLQLKERGKPMMQDKKVMDQLHGWIIGNIPKTLQTKGIWKETD